MSASESCSTSRQPNRLVTCPFPNLSLRFASTMTWRQLTREYPASSMAKSKPSKRRRFSTAYRRWTIQRVAACWPRWPAFPRTPPPCAKRISDQSWNACAVTSRAHRLPPNDYHWIVEAGSSTNTSVPAVTARLMLYWNRWIALPDGLLWCPGRASTSLASTGCSHPTANTAPASCRTGPAAT